AHTRGGCRTPRGAVAACPAGAPASHGVRQPGWPCRRTPPCRCTPAERHGARGRGRPRLGGRRTPWGGVAACPAGAPAREGVRGGCPPVLSCPLRADARRPIGTGLVGVVVHVFRVCR